MPQPQILMDVSPLEKPVDVVDYLMREIASLRFDPGDPSHRGHIDQAKATYVRLRSLDGKLRFETADRMLLYTLGRAIDDPDFASELGRAVDQVLQLHRGVTTASAGRSVLELLTDEENPSPKTTSTTTRKSPKVNKSEVS